MGADVVKVEIPTGEVGRLLPPFVPETAPPLSFMHATVNRNKRSVTLDLRRPEGADLLLRLVACADLFVENFRPGTLERWGLGYAALAELRPDLVYVSISGYGQFGSLSERAGYDPIAQAASGWLSLNGEPGGSPVKAPTFIGDDVAGLHAALSALGALRHRDRTGEGQHVDVSLLDCLLFQSNGYPMLAAMGLELERPELAHHPDYATTAARVARRDELDELVESWSGKQTTEALVARLTAEGLPASAVRSFAEAAADPRAPGRAATRRRHRRDPGRAGSRRGGAGAPASGGGDPARGEVRARSSSDRSPSGCDPSRDTPGSSTPCRRRRPPER
jgi:formyl-CoA transferase